MTLRRQPPPDEADAGAALVVAGAGLAVDVAGAGDEVVADAGAAGLVGKNKGPFCPQPASSPVPSNSSDAETTMRRRMHAIPCETRREYRRTAGSPAGLGCMRVAIRAAVPATFSDRTPKAGNPTPTVFMCRWRAADPAAFAIALSSLLDIRS